MKIVSIIRILFLFSFFYMESSQILFFPDEVLHRIILHAFPCSAAILLADCFQNNGIHTREHYEKIFPCLQRIEHLLKTEQNENKQYALYVFNLLCTNKTFYTFTQTYLKNIQQSLNNPVRASALLEEGSKFSLFDYVTKIIETGDTTINIEASIKKKDNSIILCLYHEIKAKNWDTDSPMIRAMDKCYWYSALWKKTYGSYSPFFAFFDQCMHLPGMKITEAPHCIEWTDKDQEDSPIDNAWRFQQGDIGTIEAVPLIMLLLKPLYENKSVLKHIFELPAMTVFDDKC